MTETTHTLYDREDGLAHCSVCNGAEGSLPTDCPGERMKADIEDLVYAQVLDFQDGDWVAGRAQAMAADASYRGIPD